MQKLEQIDKKQVLTEGTKPPSWEKEGEWSKQMKKQQKAFEKKQSQINKSTREQGKQVEETAYNWSIKNTLLREFDLDEADSAPVTNPYTNPADAAKFARMSPEDQAALTQGGQVPDINDPYILSRMPNKGRAVIDPKKLARFKELLTKVTKAGGPASAPTAPAAGKQNNWPADPELQNMLASFGAKGGKVIDPSTGNVSSHVSGGLPPGYPK